MANLKFKMERYQSKKFKIKEISPSQYQERSFNALSLPAKENSLIKVIIHPEVYEKVIENRKYSMDYEEGGFFIGNVYQDTDQRDGHIVEITAAFDAKYVGATVTEIIFTGEAFSEIKRILRQDHTEKKLIGWYHTHLFPAGKNKMGLSSTDFNLHFTTFRFNWQVAGLINIENDYSNKLRFYVRKGSQWNMELIPFWVAKIEQL